MCRPCKRSTTAGSTSSAPVKPIAAEIVTVDLVGHWPDREIHGPDELQQTVRQTRNMMAYLNFAIQIGPQRDGDMVAGRWVGTSRGPDGSISFTGNDILRLTRDGQRFAEYWTGTSTGWGTRESRVLADRTAAGHGCRDRCR
jgi:hypothetical protein